MLYNIILRLSGYKSQSRTVTFFSVELFVTTIHIALLGVHKANSAQQGSVMIEWSCSTHTTNIATTTYPWVPATVELVLLQAVRRHPDTNMFRRFERCLLDIHSFIHQWLYSPLLGPGLFCSFIIIFTQTVGLLGRVISPWQGKLTQTQNKHSGIRTDDPSVRASEDRSCLKLHGYCDRRLF
jgi:hypothetical protein